MSKFKNDLESIKAHYKAISDILAPYGQREEIVNLEKEIIDGYKKLHAHKTKMLEIQKNITIKALEVDRLIKQFYRNDDRSNS
jgi:undecaprenyl pyrophosphate synthase